jgi:hypothetical protein
MARIRTIKPEFFCHEELFDLEEETGLPIRIAFAGLWTVCDREGRFKWRPRTIKAQIMPYDNLDFSRVLDALATRGFVVRYASNGCEYGHVPGFGRHQVINNRENASTLPEPPKTQEKMGLSRVVDACPTRDERVPHAGKEEGKGREGERKGMEGVTSVEADAVVDAWNKSSASAKVKKLTGDRATKLRARLRDPDWPWREAIAKLPIPNTEKFDWQPDFDWLVANDRNAYSLAEGKYDRKHATNGQGPGVNYDPNHDYESEAF